MGTQLHNTNWCQEIQGRLLSKFFRTQENQNFSSKLLRSITIGDVWIDILGHMQVRKTQISQCNLIRVFHFHMYQLWTLENQKCETEFAIFMSLSKGSKYSDLFWSASLCRLIWVITVFPWHAMPLICCEVSEILQNGEIGEMNFIITFISVV